MPAPLAERLVRVLLFEQPLLESARFGQCRNRFCTHLYSRPSVRTHRGSHPTRPGHLGAERRKVTWFR